MKGLEKMAIYQSKRKEEDSKKNQFCPAVHNNKLPLLEPLGLGHFEWPPKTQIIHTRGLPGLSQIVHTCLPILFNGSVFLQYFYTFIVFCIFIFI